MKTCTKCGQSKAEEEFHRKGSGRHFCCKICQNAYTKEHYKKNKPVYLKKAKVNRVTATNKRREAVRKLKEVPCTDCGVSYPHYVMDFDHLKDKQFNISEELNGYGVSMVRLLAEIAKCEVVCSNCHRIRTHNRKQNNDNRSDERDV